jgi:1,4-alpha-glucan branching enzyme
MTSPIGSFALVLHSHLPFVIGHGKWPHGMDWLNEAAAETYIPLLNVINSMVKDKVKFAITFDISPVLAEQLADGRFKEGFIDYLDIRIQMSRENITEFEKTGDGHKKYLAGIWLEYYERIKSDFINIYRKDLISAFKKLEEGGYIEIITCGATHGYFPLLYTDEAINAQVKQAIKTHKRLFGRAPDGIWLPECAYRPRYEWKSFIDETDTPRTRRGVEEFLSDSDIKYFIIDSHLLKGGRAIGTYLSRFEALQKLWDQFSKNYKEEDKNRTPFKTYWVGNQSNDKMAAVYSRNEKTSLQVWSGEWGYPGNGRYLDFHKKHFPGGNRYWAVTGPKVDLADKQMYVPEVIESILYEQASHFAETIKGELNAAGGGILTAPFDCELFGHWWFEGPRWIRKVFEALSAFNDVKPVTLREYYNEKEPEEVISLPEGSWGEGGFHYIWLNDWTKWTWKHVHDNEKTMTMMAERWQSNKNPDLEKVLNQMGRELLLLEASDWQFLISTWSARDYAEARVSVHNDNFTKLAEIAEKTAGGSALTTEENNLLSTLLEIDSLFPDIDFRIWAKLPEN